MKSKNSEGYAESEVRARGHYEILSFWEHTNPGKALDFLHSYRTLDNWFAPTWLKSQRTKRPGDILFQDSLHIFFFFKIMVKGEEKEAKKYKLNF